MTRFASLLLLVLLGANVDPAADKPNFIIIFTDDQGYNDLSCFGSKKIRTPHLDQLAKEGRRLTSFYVAANVCSPSRAALMTGCYPKRVGMEKHVIFPAHNHGLHTDEVTIADLLKSAGYATACVGKWHLGHRKPFLPTSQGFDSYYGIPYSNDMNHPDNKGKPGDTRDKSWKDQDKYWRMWKTPLMQDEKIVELPVNQRTITRRYVDRAIEFVKASKAKPFFLYLPHSMPHIPLFVPKDVYDPNPQNAYTNTIEHIDAEVGRLLKTVKDLNLSKKTYIIFTTDNGPWLQFGNHGGSALPLRAGKGTTYEGGHRVPFIIKGPGVPAGTVSDAFATSMDLLPSIAKLTGLNLRTRGKIDGMDITAVLKGSNDSPRSEMLYYAARGGLEGLRQGDWKLRLAGGGRKGKGKPELYNLRDDISEKHNLADSNTAKVAALTARMRELDAEITENVRPRGNFSQ
jgi:arylsulfatase A